MKPTFCKLPRQQPVAAAGPIGAANLPRRGPRATCHAGPSVARVEDAGPSASSAHTAQGGAGLPSVPRASGHPSPAAPVPAAPTSLPAHVAIIMDGNSRWARRHHSPAFSGHQRGVDALRLTVRCCCQWGIPCLTVFALSTENLHRETAEVEALLGLIERVLRREVEELHKAGVQLRFIGDRSALPAALRTQLAAAEARTAGNAALHLNVALNYSGQQVDAHCGTLL